MPKDYQTSQYDKPITVERSARRRRRTHRDHARASRRGHREDPAHGRRRPHPQRRVLVRRLQPRRRPAAGDRLRARHPLCRAGEAVRRRAPGDAARDRCLATSRWKKDRSASTPTCRCDRVGSEEFGTRCEIKNLNSLRSLVKAIEHEAKRQVTAREFGDAIVQETRHWDEARGRTISGRSKEEAHDYRYFPEPDLVPVAPTDEMRADVRNTMPELPAARRARSSRPSGGSRKTMPRCSSITRAWSTTRPTAIAVLKAGSPKDVVNWVRQERARVPERDGALAGCAHARDARGARRPRHRRHDLPSTGQGRARRITARGQVATRHRRGDAASRR